MTLAWHFVGDTLRDGRPIPADGEWLRHEGKIEPCKSGLHASVKLIDALQYAPGGTLCRVEMRGDLIEHDGNKIVARERRILWRFDATDMLRAFARQCALDVIHLWDAPQVVRDYLETGDENLRAAAWVAARDAAWVAARDGAWVAARDAAWDGARDAARAAARDAAWAAARDAAWAAAWDGAWAAAWDGARDGQSARLDQMVAAEAAKRCFALNPEIAR
jgi:hypothetical protein